MTVWLVTRAWYEDSTMRDVWENVGIFSTKEKAIEAKRKAAEYMALEFGEDLVFMDADVWIEKYEIDELEIE